MKQKCFFLHTFSISRHQAKYAQEKTKQKNKNKQNKQTPVSTYTTYMHTHTYFDHPIDQYHPEISQKMRINNAWFSLV